MAAGVLRIVLTIELASASLGVVESIRI